MVNVKLPDVRNQTTEYWIISITVAAIVNSLISLGGVLSCPLRLKAYKIIPAFPTDRCFIFVAIRNVTKTRQDIHSNRTHVRRRQTQIETYVYLCTHYGRRNININDTCQWIWINNVQKTPFSVFSFWLSIILMLLHIHFQRLRLSAYTSILEVRSRVNVFYLFANYGNTLNHKKILGIHWIFCLADFAF